MKINLIAFLLLTSGLVFSQSKKEQIEILKNRVDSLNMIINNERSFNIQSAIERDAKITTLESQIRSSNELNKSLKTSLQNKELENSNMIKDRDLLRKDIDRLNRQIEIKNDSLNYYTNLETSFLKDTLFRIKQFLKSDEFNNIKKNIYGLEFNYLQNIWIESIDDTNANRELFINYFTWGVDETHIMFLHNDYIIFSYHLTAGSNTGTLIYDRKRNTYTTQYFFTSMLLNNELYVTREGYDNGHWWQGGVMNIKSGAVKWDKNIDR